MRFISLIILIFAVYGSKWDICSENKDNRLKQEADKKSVQNFLKKNQKTKKKRNMCNLEKSEWLDFVMSSVELEKKIHDKKFPAVQTKEVIFEREDPKLSCAAADVFGSGLIMSTIVPYLDLPDYIEFYKYYRKTEATKKKYFKDMNLDRIFRNSEDLTDLLSPSLEEFVQMYKFAVRFTMWFREKTMALGRLFKADEITEEILKKLEFAARTAPLHHNIFENIASEPIEVELDLPGFASQQIPGAYLRDQSRDDSEFTNKMSFPVTFLFKIDQQVFRLCGFMRLFLNFADANVFFYMPTNIFENFMFAVEVRSEEVSKVFLFKHNLPIIKQFFSLLRANRTNSDDFILKFYSQILTCARETTEFLKIEEIPGFATSVTANLSIT